MCLKRKLSASGQATFEYLFLIFFTVALVSGFIYQFNGAVKTFFDSYFSPDGYLACLIEKGLLPGESNDEGTCDIPTLDIKNAKERKVASVTFDKGKDYNYVSQAGPQGGANASSSGRGDDSGSGKNVPYGQGPGSNGISKLNNKAPPITKKSGPNTGSDGFSTTSNAGDAGDLGDGNGGGRPGMVPFSGTDNSSGSGKKTTTVPATGRDLKTARELAAEKAARKSMIKNTAGGLDLSIGNILRWVFLILLLFAIFFFIGSQILAVSNGNKKRR